jgi:hypothetical protein
LFSREPDKLLSKFLTDFPTLKLPWSVSWHDPIIQYFADLGKSEGFDTYCKNQPYEYLLDLCWYYEKDKPHITWMELAFEVEMNQDMGELMDDFAKLVDIKAYTKVFVGFVKVDEVKELLKEAREMIAYNPLKLHTEKYLIIILTETRKHFTFTGVTLDSVGSLTQLGSKEFDKM